MIVNSENTAAVGVTAQPDWSRGVQLAQIHQTAQFLSRSGMEQRRRYRRTPKYRLGYEITGLSEAEARAAATTARQETRSVCLVPFWTERAQTINAIVSDVVTIDSDPRREFFAAGQWVYFYTEADGGQFRQIASAVGRILTLETHATPIAYGAGAKVYPARRCRRIIGQDEIKANDWTRREIALLYETIGD